MNLCNSCNIVYEEDLTKCPLCKAYDKLSILKNELLDLKDEMSDLRSNQDTKELD